MTLKWGGNFVYLSDGHLLQTIYKGPSKLFESVSSVIMVINVHVCVEFNMAQNQHFICT